MSHLHHIPPSDPGYVSVWIGSLTIFFLFLSVRGFFYDSVPYRQEQEKKERKKERKKTRKNSWLVTKGGVVTSLDGHWLIGPLFLLFLVTPFYVLFYYPHLRGPRFFLKKFLYYVVVETHVSFEEYFFSVCGWVIFFVVVWFLWWWWGH